MKAPVATLPKSMIPSPTRGATIPTASPAIPVAIRSGDVATATFALRTVWRAATWTTSCARTPANSSSEFTRASSPRET